MKETPLKPIFHSKFTDTTETTDFCLNFVRVRISSNFASSASKSRPTLPCLHSNFVLSFVFPRSALEGLTPAGSRAPGSTAVEFGSEFCPRPNFLQFRLVCVQISTNFTSSAFKFRFGAGITDARAPGTTAVLFGLDRMYPGLPAKLAWRLG